MQELPIEFAERLRKQLGNDFENFRNSLNEPAPVSVRENPFKKSDKFLGYEKVAWASNAYYLPERISFTLDPLFHAGCYYVQEASSMYIEAALQKYILKNQPVKVLDLCAAPGGKSTHLLSILPHGSVLVCNEVIPSRNKILQQNITKWGVANAIVTQNESSDFKRLPDYFDIILVDAPCSGEGLFRKDPNAINEWSTQAVDRCEIRQNEILSNIVASLKNDGLLLYSTCTYEQSENDEQINKLLHDKSNQLLPIPIYDGIVSTNYGVQFYPHKIKGEGFYTSLLQKNFHSGGNINYGKPEFTSKYKEQASKFIENANDFQFYVREQELYAILDYMKQDFTLLMKNLYVRMAGVHVGQIIKNEIIPSHQLAQFIGIRSDFSRIEVDKDTALQYLRCENILLPDVSHGRHLICFEGFPLGWIKAIGNRSNNYYPKELRILKKN